MKWHHRHIMGFRIGGLTMLRRIYSPNGSRITIAAYHHPKRMCWLWFLDLRARRGALPKFSYLPGAQAKTCIALPFFEVLFCWQDQGRYTDPSDERMRKLAGVQDWPKNL